MEIAMQTSPGRACALLAVLGLGLGGCASPNIVLQPTIPAVAPSTPENQATVSLAVGANEKAASRYEEKGDKTLIGTSESLGVHISDFWVEEPPQMFIKRLLENDLKAWGFKVAPGNERNQLHGRVNKFSLQSRSISALEFQADGVIEVDLEVSQANGTAVYQNRFVGTCTHRTATEMPTKNNMERVFGACVEDFQKKVEGDANLRTALSSN
jgi:uncharacterized lipoprotein YajG